MVTEGREVVLTVASDPKNMRIVRALVALAAEVAGFPKQDGKCACLAVDEACTNIIRHAYGGDPAKRIEVRLGIHADRLDVTLRDWGRTVDPATIRPRDLADVRPGGLGVHFIREIMDAVAYEPTHGVGTVLRMTKRLPPKTAE